MVAITSADIDAVLKHAGSEGAGTDRQIKVADLGAYRLGVGVLHRGPTRPGAPRRTNSGRAARSRAATAAAVRPATWP